MRFSSGSAGQASCLPFTPEYLQILMKYPARSFKLLATALLAGFLAFSLLAGSSAETPAPGSYVNDSAGVLDPGTAGKLNSILADLDAKANAQVAVLVVKDLGGLDIETYAVKTYKEWGIGDKKTSRGVLLLVAVADHKARIEVGYGLEGILPDGLTGAIQDKYIIPYFKTGDYSSGISQGSLALASVIAEDSGVTLSAGYERGGRRRTAPMTRGQKILSVLMLIGFVIFAIRHPYLAFFLIQTMARGGGGGFGGGGFGGFGGGS
ncbi:MAG: hypothetical protein COX65_05460, partial [Elusimicrobia bacterium CG_4_10_14_0_2_um_filter_56_8]